MQPEELLTNTSLRLKKTEIATIIGFNPTVVEKLLRLSISREIPLCWRAAWILDHISELHSSLLLKHIKVIWEEIAENHPHGVTRSLLRLLTRYNIPLCYHGMAADLGLTWIEKKSVPVAIKVYALEILLKIATLYPELTEEFYLTITNQLDQNSIGYKARAKHVLRKMKAIRTLSNSELI